MESVIASLIVSALGAVVGAWIGSKAALVNLRSQRAFDRQLEWYDSTLAALGEFRKALASAVTHERLATFNDEAKRLWIGTVSSYAPVAARLEQAEAYAPNSSILRLRHLHEDFRRYNEMLSKSVADSAAASSHRLGAANDLSEAARDTAVCLALDVRRHLDLDELDINVLRNDGVLPPLPVTDDHRDK